MVKQTSALPVPAAQSIVVVTQLSFDSLGATVIATPRVREAHLQKERVIKARTLKDGTVKAAHTIPAKQVAAKTTGTIFSIMPINSAKPGVESYKSNNPDLELSGCKLQRNADILETSNHLLAYLNYAVPAGKLGAVKLVQDDRGGLSVRFAPIHGAAAPKVTDEMFLKFIADNPNHPLVVAYVNKLNAANPAK